MISSGFRILSVSQRLFKEEIISPPEPVYTNYDNSGSSSKLSINTNTDVYDSSDNIITPTFSRVLEIRPSTPVNSPRRRTKI